MPSIPDFLSMLRKRNIYDIPFGTPPFVNPNDTVSPLNPPQSPLLSLPSRPTPATDQYKEFLGSQPNREDYKPSKLNRILASVAGFAEGLDRGPMAGFNASRSIVDRPYKEATERWSDKGGRLKELADLEYKGLSDQDKLTVQIAKNQIDIMQEARQWLKTQSDIKVSEKQIENITSQINNRGLSVHKNDVTGDLEVIDSKNGQRQSLGQFALSEKEKVGKEKNMFSFEEGVRQGNRRSLQEDSQSHAFNLENLRTTNDEKLATYRDKLTKDNKELEERIKGMSPSAQRDAFRLAFEQTALDLGTDNATKLQSEDPAKFVTEVRKRLGNIRNRSSSPTGQIPSIDIPISNSKIPEISLNNGMTNSNQLAIDERKKIGFPNPTPQMIEEAKKDLGLK